MKCALLTQISQPVLTILASRQPRHQYDHIINGTHRSTTSHSTQQTRCRLIRRLVLTTAQPRNRNDLLHRLTSNPVTSRRSRIRRDNLAIYHQPGSNISLFFSRRRERRTIPPWKRKASVVVPWASLMGQFGFEWSSVIARRKPEG